MAFKFKRVAFKIPVTIIFNGEKSRKYKGLALKCLYDLDESRMPQSIPTAKKTVKLANDVYADLFASNTSHVIDIYSIGAKGDRVPGKRKECFCFPCFSFGIIKNIRTVPNDTEYYKGVRFEYDILICQKNRYILFENFEVKSAGWEEYYVGQFVIVTIDVESITNSLPTCCSNKTCLFSDIYDINKLVPGCFQIVPLHILGKMKRYVIVQE